MTLQDRHTSGIVVAYGALTLAAQVILLREFLILARGNELQLGVGLWAWLFWAGWGSLGGGRWGGDRGAGALGWLLLALGWCLPLTLLAGRAAPLVLRIPLGQDLPVMLTAGLGFALMAPFAFLSGWFFPLAARALETVAGAGAGGRAYALETLGAALGGAGVQLLLVRGMGSLSLVLGLGCLAAVTTLLGTRGPRAPVPSRGLPWAAGVSLGLGVALLTLSPYLDGLSRQWQTPGGRLLAVTETPSQVLSATREIDQVSVFSNNLWYFSFPDPLSAQEQVHYALLQHPGPRRVLLLGGGAAGLAAEVLKSPGVTHLDVVEADPRLLPWAREVLPPEASRVWDDPRVRLQIQDARGFVRDRRQTYDVIILSLPEPKSALWNRFYSLEFFREVRRRLGEEGVVSFALTGGQASLSPWRARYLGLAYHTLKQVFGEVIVFPGVTVRFFASPRTGGLTVDPDVLERRLKDRGLELLYVREDDITDRLAPGRLAYLQGILAGLPPALNTDLQPQCYFYDLLLGARMEDRGLQEVLLAVQRLPGWVPPVGLIALILMGIPCGRRGGGAPILASVLVMGVSVMALEMVVIILFQIVRGEVYGQLALLLAAFMLGMATGAGIVSRLRLPTRPLRRLALLGLGGLALLSGLLGLGLPWLSGIPLLGLPVLGPASFGGVLWLAGALGGGLFAVQARVWVQQGRSPAAGAGYLYAADLLGATLGTFGASLMAVPLWGLQEALGLVALLNLGALALLASARPRPEST